MSALLAATSIDWTNILLALIAALPGIIAAVYAGRIHSHIKTPSGKRIGAQVEDVLHTARANYYNLDSVRNAVRAPTSADAHHETSQISDPPTPNGVKEATA